MKTVAYTAILGGYDSLKNQPTIADDFVAFGDAKTKPQWPWQLRPSRVKFPNLTLAARWHKMMSHKLFPDCEVSLWVDGCVEIIGKDTVEQMAEKYLIDADVALFKHQARTCIYDEAWECIKKKRGNRDLIYQQIYQYTQDGYLPNQGLAETPVILRRHSEAVKALNEAWWRELSTYSSRDQISFNYLVHKMGIKVRYFPGTIQDNELFKKHLHRTTYIQGNIARTRKKLVVWKRQLLTNVLRRPTFRHL
jgi:hypothetical protein